MSKKKHKIISIFLSIFKISSLSVVGFFLVLFIAKNIKVESDRLLEQGIAQLQSRQFDQATQSWNKSLKLYRLIGHRQGIAYSLGNLGNIYFSLDDYSQAIKYYQQSLEIKREIGDRQGIANSLGNLGRTYSLLGDDTQAIDYYQQSLKIEREIGDYEGIAISLRKLGSIYRSSGDYDRAIDYYQQSLKIYRDIGNFRKGIARSLHSLGATYYLLGDYATTIDYYAQSMEIYQDIDDRYGMASITFSLGVLYYSLENYAQAIEYYEKSLEKFRKLGAFSEEESSFYSLGILYDRLQQYDKAEEYLWQAIEVEEEVRDPDLIDELKITFYDTQRWSYRILQKVLVAQNESKTALTVAERGRARAFVELLSQRLSGNSDSTIEPPNIEQIQQIAANHDATIVLYSRMWDKFSIENQQKWRESELYIWVVKPTGEITLRRTDLKPLWQKDNTFLSEVIANARCFDDLTCRSDLQVIASRSGLPEVRSGVAFNLQAQAAQVIETPDDNKDSLKIQSFKQLHQLLIDPIADLLPSDPNAHVIFIPQGSLFLVPFPALIDENGTYLIEKHTILTAPSIQSLDLTDQQQQQFPSENITGRDVLIVGNPTMPLVAKIPGEPPQQLPRLGGAEREAQNIANLFKADFLTGNQATKSAVIEQMQNSRIIHLATHGSFDANQGNKSWIAFAPDSPNTANNGLLTAEEIVNLDLNAELVVLSACETGRGKIGGDGVIGLSRAFISAGSASVLVSLWPVGDDATALIMDEFYQNWLESGDKAAALRSAMLAAKERYSSVEHWAAFTLIGEAE